MPKKSKTPKKTVKPKKVSKSKPKKSIPRKNPNQVRRIPAVVGQRSTSNITEVVAPSGSRGGDGSYKKRSKEEIQQEKIEKATALLGIQQSTQPSVRKVFANVKPPDMSRYGGYSGLTSGYGIRNNEKFDEKFDERFKNMEQRLLNEIKNQNNSVSLKQGNVSRTSQTTTTRTLENKSDLAQDELSDVRTELKRQLDKQELERKQKEQYYKARDEKKRIREQKEQEKQERERELSDVRTELTRQQDKQRKQQEQEKQERERKLSDVRTELRKQQEQEKQERERKQKEQRKQQEEKEDEIRPLEINRANISKQNEFPKVEKSEEDRINEIIDTQEDIDESGRQLIERIKELDDGEFSDVNEPQIQQNPTPIKAQLPSRSNTQSTQTAVSQGIPISLSDRATKSDLTQRELSDVRTELTRQQDKQELERKQKSERVKEQKKVSEEIIELEKIRNKEEKKKEQKKNEKEISDLIEGVEIKRLSKDLVEGAVAGESLIATQREKGVKISQKGAKSKTLGRVEEIVSIFERGTPDSASKKKKMETIRPDLEEKNRAEIELNKIKQELYEFGLDGGKPLSFDASKFLGTASSKPSKDDDERLRRIVKEEMKKRPIEYPIEFQNRVMTKIAELLKAKNDLRFYQNKSRQYAPKKPKK